MDIEGFFKELIPTCANMLTLFRENKFTSSVLNDEVLAGTRFAEPCSKYTRRVLTADFRSQNPVRLKKTEVKSAEHRSCFEKK